MTSQERWRRGTHLDVEEVRVREAKRSTGNYELRKYLTPEAILPSIHAGDVTYVELDELRFFDYSLVKTLGQIRQRGKPVVVNITENAKGDGLFTKDRLRHMLACLESVDGVIVPKDEAEAFQLIDDPIAFHHNCIFLNRSLSAKSAELVKRPLSLFADEARDIHLSHPKLLHQDDLIDAVTYYQNHGLEVVIVTGVLDLLHPGHIDFLETASRKGQVLIILTNSDYSASMQDKNKSGAGDRPVYPLRARLPTLGALEFVDHIVVFDTKAALPILQGLKGIKYVKTEKDMTSDTVLNEIKAVEENGGEVLVLPTIKNPFTSRDISTTMTLSTARARAKDEILASPNLSLYPVEVIRIFNDVIEMIKIRDKGDSHLYNWIRDLRRRYRTSLEDAANIERWVMEEICSWSRSILSDLPAKRPYYKFVIPYLIGKMIDLDIRITPIIYRTDAELELINAVLLSDGRVAFFAADKPAVYEPFNFEQTFWRAFSHQGNFIPREGIETFASRIYIHPKERHNLGIAASILLRASEDMTDEMFIKAFERVIRSVWLTYIQRPLGQTTSAKMVGKKGEEIDKKLLTFNMPGIIGHGGEAVLNTAGGFAENSRSGLQTSLRKGIMIELDVVPCKNGWIVSHDMKLEIATEVLDRGRTTLNFTEEDLCRVKLRLADGSISEETLMTLSQALAVIAEHREQKAQIAVKIDIKYSTPDSEVILIEKLRESGLSLDQILVTSGIPQVSERIHELAPQLHFEFNPIEPLLFLFGFNIQHRELIPKLILEFFQEYAPSINARTISLPQFAMQRWGIQVYQELVHGIQKMGLESQVWVVGDVKNYLKAALIGVDNVLMHDPTLISKILELREKYNPIRDELAELIEKAINEMPPAINEDEYLSPVYFFRQLLINYSDTMSKEALEFINYLISSLET